MCSFASDGPQACIVPVASLRDRLSFYDEARITPAEYHTRIAARQAAVANRMVG
jgi:hypothetical protein